MPPYAIDNFITEPKIAYFSMEIGLNNDMKTYSGGLGVLVVPPLAGAGHVAVPETGLKPVPGACRRRVVYPASERAHGGGNHSYKRGLL